MSIPVLHFITELSTGGAQSALLRILKGMDRTRFEPSVVCLYNGDGAVAEQIRLLNIDVFDLGMTRKWRLDAFAKLYSLLQTLKPAILHTWMFHANIPGRIIGYLAGVPIIISSERTMGQEGRLRLAINRWTSGLATKIICVSVQVADFAAEKIGLAREKLVVIPNGIDLSLFDGSPDSAKLRAELDVPVNAFVLCALGRPRPVKGYEILIEAFASVAQRHTNSHLLFVGDGPDQPKLQAQVRRLQLEEQISFSGDRNDIPAILSCVDLLVSSSIWEGMPNVVIEAMAASLPVVATAVGGTPEVVADMETGLLVPPQDSAALAAAIHEMVAAPERGKVMGRVGRKRVEEKFSIQNTVGLTQQIYEKTLNSKRIESTEFGLG